MDIQAVQKKIFQNKINKGFNTDNVEKEFCFLYGEVSEAFDAFRKKKEHILIKWQPKDQPAGTNAKQAEKPITTVTVWFDCIHWVKWPVINEWEAHGKFGKFHYSFSGTPDIDHVIHDTLDKGALAVHIHCNEFFVSDPEAYKTDDMIMLSGCLQQQGSKYRETNITFWHAGTNWYNRIESAITEYLSKQDEQEIKEGDTCWNGDKSALYRIDNIGLKGDIVISDVKCEPTNGHIRVFTKASADEVLKYFTVEVDGNRYVAWKDDIGRIILTDSNEELKAIVTRGGGMVDFILLKWVEHNHITPIPYAWVKALWPDGNVPYPKGKQDELVNGNTY